MKIFVNATASNSSGALTILGQFISNIPSNSDDYYIFVNDDVFVIENKNVHFVTVDTKKWANRILWDSWGFKRWAINNNVFPDLIISFQNTTVRYSKNICQIIYYHQPLPFSPYNWSLLKKSECKLFFYKNFYSFFVRLYLNDNTIFVVQIPSLKEAILKKFKLKKSNIYVIRPYFDNAQINNSIRLDYDTNYFHFIYPATPLIYKNHLVLVEAIKKMYVKNKEIASKIKIHFTCTECDLKKINKLITEYGINNNFIFEGVIPHEDLIIKYRQMNGLLFPSFVETFGLPLIESASIGLPIIVSDLPYSRDVIGNYTNAHFVIFNDAEQWSDAILKLCINSYEREPVFYPNPNNWNDFFKIVEQQKMRYETF